MSCGRAPRPRMNGKLLLLVMTAALISGCANKAAESSYKVTIPLLTAEPLRHKCETPEGPTICKCFVESDINLIIRKLKAACLASGGTEDACQTKTEIELRASGSP